MSDTTWRSLCGTCSGRISYDTKSAQWEHDDAADATHPPEPELRFAIDATCPGCDFPEIGYAVARSQFVCSRCGFTSDTRPAS